jgi:hypothetical protein
VRKSIGAYKQCTALPSVGVSVVPTGSDVGKGLKCRSPGNGS